MSLLPTTEIQNCQEYVKSEILKNQNRISLIYLNRKIFLKFSEKFGDNSLEHLVDKPVTEGKKVGNILKTSADSYVFIESENEKYFAHYTSFNKLRNATDLRKIKEGQMVSFEEGKNSKGICAINVNIISG
jgi:LuxR family glucitol operon transcriptional activator